MIHVHVMTHVMIHVHVIVHVHAIVHVHVTTCRELKETLVSLELKVLKEIWYVPRAVLLLWELLPHCITICRGGLEK